MATETAISKDGAETFLIAVSTIQRNLDSVICTIITRTTDGRFKAGTVEAQRSLTDFATFQDDLIAAHPDVIVPGLAVNSLPEDDGLLRHALSRVLTRISAIEQLRQDPATVAFLQGEDRPGGKKKNNPLQIPGLPLPPGLNLAAQLQAVRDLVPSKHVPESDIFYEEQRTNVHKLDVCFRDATRTVDKVQRAHSSFVTALRDVAAKLQNSADTEMAGTMSAPLHQLSTTLFKSLELTEKQNTVEYGTYALWLHSQSATLHNCKLALASRTSMSEKYDGASKNTRKKRESAEKAKGEKVGKAQAELAEAEKQEADAKEAFFHVSDSLKGEFDRVDKQRAYDTKTTLSLIANNQVKLAKDVRGIFEAHGGV
jgi:hypothetical protein